MARIIAIAVAIIAAVLIITSLMHLFVIGFWILVAGLVVFGAFRIGRVSGKSRK